MITRLRGRALRVPAAACALLLATVLIVSAVGRADARGDAAEPAMTRVAGVLVDGAVWSPRARHDDDDVITVRGRTCPKSHPHKIGSSTRRWTRIDDGEVKRGTRRSAICAR